MKNKYCLSKNGQFVAFDISSGYPYLTDFITQCRIYETQKQVIEACNCLGREYEIVELDIKIIPRPELNKRAQDIADKEQQIKELKTEIQYG